MSADTLFMKAGNLRRVCEITRADGSSLLVEPYAIFTSSRNKLEYLCFQVSEPQGWRELDARTVASVKLRDSQFTTRPDYNPLDRDRYPLMHYSILTHDGRQSPQAQAEDKRRRTQADLRRHAEDVGRIPPEAGRGGESQGTSH